MKAVCIFVLTFTAWMLIWKRIPTLFLEYKRCWRAWWALATFPAWISKSRFWQIKMEEALKQYTALTVGILGFFECDRMSFGLCNALATFQQLMQNCMGELNLIYCLIYLDDLIVFSWMVEEHLHQLCVIFDWIREYNLETETIIVQSLQRRDKLPCPSSI